MPSGFHPELDAVPTDPPGPDDLDAIHRILNRQVPSALAPLRESFFGAVDLYRLDAWTRNFAADVPASLVMSCGAAFAALDYFHARELPPSEPSPEHLQSRALTIFTNHGTGLMRSLAVATKIPDNWIPAQAVETQLRRRMKAHGYAAASVVIDIQLPTPGGLAWLRRESRSDIDRVARQLAVGHPCPVFLFSGAGDGTCASAAVVWSLLDGKYHLYDPLHGTEPRLLSTEDAVGLIALSYSPVLPPANLLCRLLRRLHLQSVPWHVFRRWNLWRNPLR